MNGRQQVLLMVGCFLLLLSCKKEEEHSCYDGVQSPGEWGIDCGGVCPPCSSNEGVQEFFLVSINGTPFQFSNRSFEYYDDWVFNFQNDTVNISLNFGSLSEPGVYSIKSLYSEGTYGFKDYDNLYDGQLLLTEKDAFTNRVSGYFEARLLGYFFDSLLVDTLYIQNGDFENLPLN